jgi:hypothetical protein
MRKLSKITLLAGMVLAIMLLVQPAFAACSNARLIQASEIYGTDGEFPSYNASAWFWALGSGVQGVGSGNDNGAVYGSTDGYGTADYGFFGAPYTYGYGYVSASWGTGGVDGCIDATVAPTLCNVGGCCTAILISDQFDGQGYFALLTSTADAGQNYGAFPAVNMAALPKPNITGSVRVDAANVNVTVACPSQASLAGGLALDPGCPDTVVTGCKLYTQTVARGGAPADDRELSGWTSVGVGAAAGTSETVGVTCSGNQDVYLTSALVFDSGFELRYGGTNSTRVECGPNLANPVRRLQDGTTPTRKKSRRTN